MKITLTDEMATDILLGLKKGKEAIEEKISDIDALIEDGYINNEEDMTEYKKRLRCQAERLTRLESYITNSCDTPNSDTPYHYTFAVYGVNPMYLTQLHTTEKNLKAATDYVAHQTGVDKDRLVLVNFYDETTEKGGDNE